MKKKGATAIITESQRSHLSFVLVEASGWACHCDGRCPSAARALLISNHIDEKEFTTAIFSALFHGRGKQRKIALLVPLQMTEIFHLGPNEGDLPTGQCVLGTIGFRLSTAPCGGVK